MNNAALQIIDHGQIEEWDSKAAILMDAALSGKSERTREAYAAGWRILQSFTKSPTPGEMLRKILIGPGQTEYLGLRFKADALEQGLAPKTVNLRLCALRALIRAARRLHWITWEIDVEDVKTESYRDTRGPGEDGVRKLLDTVLERGDKKGFRDYALLRLLFDLGLRRKEAVGLDVEDLDFEGDRIAILGKGRTQKEWMTIPPKTKTALIGWLEIRGYEPGPVFINLSRGKLKRGERITLGSVSYEIRKLGARIGVKVTPHALRHSAITSALDKSNGNLRAVQRFSRHKDPRIISVYDDNRQDLAGEMAVLVSSGV